MSTFSQSGLFTLTPKVVDGRVTVADAIQVRADLANGTGANQADFYWRGTVSVPNNGNGSLDLTALPVEAYEATGTVGLSKVKTMMIRNLGNLTVTVANNVTNQFPAFGGNALATGSMVLLHDPSAAGLSVGNTTKAMRFEAPNGNVTQNGTANGTSITGLNTSTLYAGMRLGTTHPANTTIATVANSTAVTTSANVTTNGSGTFTFTPSNVSMDVVVTGVII